MEKEYELIIQEAEFLNDAKGVFDGTILCMEFFVAKRKAAYDAQTDEPMLQRKDRRRVNELVDRELKALQKRLEDEPDVRPLRQLDDLFQVLEEGIGGLFSPEDEIEFANLGIEGFIQVHNNPEILGRHSDVLLDKVMRSMEDEM
ncbi:hypothetical protein [Listeria booriae]|uniref:hypothetical protein n=1 Tax=Listeria booriae TaxID=1552123 RepID=UPI001625E9EF|nr:hypothetical protein [Listeria booriae]MBC2036348.1 hypothetical protein [Listeria booriae]